jgi:hypothetical protein
MINRENKTNIRCKNCKHFDKRYNMSTFTLLEYCYLTKDEKNYWNRCKKFEWKEIGGTCTRCGRDCCNC